MKLVENLLSAFYNMYRSKRDFSAAGSANACKFWSAILIALTLNLAFNCVYALFISKEIYKSCAFWFDYDAYVFIAIALALAYLRISAEYWEERYQQEGTDYASYIQVIILFVISGGANAGIEEYIGKFE